MKKLIAAAVCLMLLVMPVMAHGSGWDGLFGALFGECFDEPVRKEASTMSMETAVKALHEAGLEVEWDLIRKLPVPPETVLDVLIWLGLGECDPDTLEITPVSHVVYAFDAEVFDVEHMYTAFLNGIRMIVPDVEITDIQEDLSGITPEMDFSKEIPTDGKRSFSFVCNGTPYALELDSLGDWFHDDAIRFVQSVLRKENCPKRLCVIDVMAIQGCVMFYADEETISNVLELLGIQEGETVF